MSNSRNSVTIANIIFNHRPEVKLTAIRDSATSYTIIRRDEAPSDNLFNIPQNPRLTPPLPQTPRQRDPRLAPSLPQTLRPRSSVQLLFLNPETRRLPSILELRDSIARAILSERAERTEGDDEFNEFVNRTLLNHQSRPTPLSREILSRLEEVPAETLLPNLREENSNEENSNEENSNEENSNEENSNEENPSKEKCSICLEDFVTEDRLISLHCGHMYHSNCLRQWFSVKNTCPQCRAIPRV